MLFLMNETVSPAPNDSSADWQKLVAGQVVGHDVAQLPALGRGVLDVPHVEINAAAIEQEPAIAGRLLVVAIMQVDRARPHPAEEMIFHPHRPGVAVGVRGVAAHQAAIFGLDPCDPIHRLRASDTAARVDKGQCAAQLCRMSTKPFPARSPAEKVGGLVHFGRMLDKIRAHARGELPAEYVPEPRATASMAAACASSG